MRRMKGIMLRTPAAALALAIALSIAPYVNTDFRPEGLVTGCLAASGFDEDALESAFGMTFDARGYETHLQGIKAAEYAVIKGGIKRLIYCLDLSEAASYDTLVPVGADPLEKIGGLDVYMQQHGSGFASDGGTVGLTEAEDALDDLERLKELCDDNKVGFTLVITPLHSSRYDTLDEKDLKSYKKSLASIADVWDFSFSSFSGDARYFASKDVARHSLCDMMTFVMSGAKEGYPEGFGHLLTRRTADKQLRAMDKIILPSEGSYTCRVPILLYHHISEDAGNRAEVTPATFRAHMEAIKNAGYTAVTTRQMIDYVWHGGDLPDKPIYITFDDGYLSNYEIAYPILKELGLKATIFTIGSSIGKDTYKNTAHPITPHFTYAQAQEMERSGVIEIESHTFDMHQSALYEGARARQTATPLAGESISDYIAALSRDYAAYENAYDFDFSALAYPKGQYTAEAEELFHSLGIKLTVSTTTDRENILVRWQPQSLYALCRWDIPNEMSASELLELIK
ncbi:MAG: polysaccharide deacetylase family protein [Clostridia bacterium]|nr:polysaccharide deacetylase family protein [Clostridia bacterium]